MDVLTAAEMREADRITIEELGIPGVVLMEHAGRAVAEAAARLAPPGARVVAVCGAGNNGGDGYVAARWLRERGFDARVVLVAGRPRAGGDAALHLSAYEKLGGRVVDRAGLAEQLAGAAVVVDAIFGTGLTRVVEGDMAEVMREINALSATRLAVDIPSGLDADTGAILGACVAADATVSFAFAKVGLVSAPGFERVGALEVVDIGIPRGLAARLGVKLRMIEESDARAWVPRRPRGGHKGTFGHLLVIAGSPGKTGAALLCASAGLRAGAGLCTLATPPEVRPMLEGRAWEVMVAELDAERAREDALDRLTALAAGKRALAWGPGMPTSPAAGELLRAALRVLEPPLVLDADALNHLAHDPAILAQARAPVVLTPHPGEAARLLGSDVPGVQADRVGAARRLAASTNAVVVLKGARSVIAAPDGRALLNPTGNPGMGTGGTGDVLTGVVGALLAQGLAPFEAAALGAYVHGLAGDLARGERGELGLVAGDLLQHLPSAFACLLGKEAESTRQHGACAPGHAPRRNQ
jgi:ADP-dependent NAD(P)H-hydrate dehydratase / NAD(P)H-hydrate epimerase